MNYHENGLAPKRMDYKVIYIVILLTRKVINEEDEKYNYNKYTQRNKGLD